MLLRHQRALHNPGLVPNPVHTRDLKTCLCHRSNRRHNLACRKRELRNLVFHSNPRRIPASLEPNLCLPSNHNPRQPLVTRVNRSLISRLPRNQRSHKRRIPVQVLLRNLALRHNPLLPHSQLPHNQPLRCPALRSTSVHHLGKKSS